MRLLLYLILLISTVVSFGQCDGVTHTETNNTVMEKQTISETEPEVTSEPVIKTEVNAEEKIATSEYDDSKAMTIHFIDVGQADSAFIELANGQTMLIDAGQNADGDDVVRYIQGLKYKDIDYVVATHPHDDHIGGMPTVLDAFDIGKMYMPRQVHTTNSFENMLNAIEENDIELYTAKAGTNIITDDNIKIDILAPIADNNTNLNNCSAVVRIVYGNSVVLFTGDAEREIEQQLLNNDIDADILKVGHHGSNTSSAPNFIRAVTPEVAVISCGKGNSYGHPNDDTLAILNQVGANVYRTDEQGTIVVTVDADGQVSVDKKASPIKENAPPVIVNDDKKEVEEDNSVKESENNAKVVYRTRTGKKYHRGNCSYLKSKIETTIDDAVAMGLEPCSRCKLGR